MNKNKGITLVALVITIIVLIILAGVSINAIMNDGLIGNAKNASSEYEKTKQEEQIAIGDLVQEIENVKGSWIQNRGTITNKNDSTITYTVGDIVNYTPQTEVTTYKVSKEKSGYTETEYQEVEQEDDITWLVLGVNENGRLQLIGTPTETIKVGRAGRTEGELEFVHEMYEALYSNPSKGTIASGMTSDVYLHYCGIAEGDGEVWFDSLDVDYDGKFTDIYHGDIYESQELDYVGVGYALHDIGSAAESVIMSGCAYEEYAFSYVPVGENTYTEERILSAKFQILVTLGADETLE